MITIKVQLKEFMGVTPVSDADVEMTVKVIPRWEKMITADESPDHHPHREIIPRHDLAESFIQGGRSAPDGSFQHSFNVAAAFQRLKQLTDESGDEPFDVVAVPSIRVAVAGLERTINFFGSLPRREGPDLLDEDTTIERTIVLDFAKSIVGHTTPSSTMLWFALHGMSRPGDRYVCEIDRGAPPPQPVPLQTLPVTFDAAGAANTNVLEVTGLQPATQYTYTPRLRTAGDADQPRTGRVLARGAFVTAPATADRLSLVFSSCHSPTTGESLNRWQALTNRDDYDLMLLLGDQVYEDNIELLGDDWFTRYVNRYHPFWTYWPMREVLGRTPTYMSFDDHEVRDDWGITPDGPHPILGTSQFDALRAWARGEAREADVIFFVTSVPIAFLPIEEIRRLIEKVQEEVTEGGAIIGGILGGLLGGPFGALLGSAAGAYAGHEIVEKELERAGFGDLTTHDMADQWTFEANQRELTQVLETLFDLANDIQEDGSHGQRPRAVFILGGDVHTDSIHMISPDTTKKPQHSRNPHIFHLTSSPISKHPTDKEIFVKAVQHIQSELDISKLDLVKSGGNFAQLAEELLGRLLVPSALHEDIKHMTILVHRSPQIMPFAIDDERHLIEMPLVARSGTAAMQLIGILLPEFPAPLADSLRGHEDAPDKEQLFAIPVAEAAPIVEPDPMPDDLSGKTVMFIAVSGWGNVHALLPVCHLHTMHHLRLITGRVCHTGHAPGKMAIS